MKLSKVVVVAVGEGNWCIPTPYQQHYLISFQDAYQFGFLSFT